MPLVRAASRRSATTAPAYIQILLVCVVLGCRGSDSVEPRAERELRPNYSLGGGESKSVTLPPTQLYDPYTTASLDSFAGPRVASISVAENDPFFIYKNYPPADQGQLVASVIASGYSYSATNCVAQVMVVFPGNSLTSLAQTCGGGTRTLFWLVHGLGTVQRVGNMPGTAPPGCGPAPRVPCYYFTGGGHTVEVQVLPASLELTATRTAVTPGQSVTFVTSANPVKYASAVVPISVQQWRWVPDGGGTTIVCGVGKTCVRTITTSGTMYVDGTVNGDPQTKSIRVYVFPCLTGDPVFDSPNVRNGLRATWNTMLNSTGLNGPERIGGLDCSSGDGECTPVTFPPGRRDNNCQAWFGDQEIPITMDTLWHTHNHDPDDPNDHLPVGPDCPKSHGGNAAKGPTVPNDLETAGKAALIVDPSYVYFLPPNRFGLVDQLAVRDWPLKGSNTNACNLLAPPL